MSFLGVHNAVFNSATGRLAIRDGKLAYVGVLSMGLGLTV